MKRKRVERFFAGEQLKKGFSGGELRGASGGKIDERAWVRIDRGENGRRYYWERLARRTECRACLALLGERSIVNLPLSLLHLSSILFK